MAGRAHLAGARHLFQPRRSPAPGPRRRGHRALSQLEHAPRFRLRPRARTAPRRVPGRARRRRQRFQRQFAPAPRSPPTAPPAIKPTGEEVQLAEVVTPPPAETIVADTTTVATVATEPTLPSTASNLPLLRLLGLRWGQ